MESSQKTGIGAVLAILGAAGMILGPTLGATELGRPWSFLVGFVVGLICGLGVTLAISQGSATLIEGKVLSEEGTAVAGATVHLSTDKAVSHSVTSGRDGRYRLLVPKEWPYQSYFVDDWPERPEVF